MYLPILAALAALVTTVATAPGVRHVLHEKRDTLAPRWTLGKRVPSLSRMPMRIGLTQRNLEGAERALLDVSHPDSPNYGKHWTSEQVIGHFAPSETTVSEVKDWLTSSGIAAHRITHSDNKGWLAFEATGAEAENLLKTKYYEHHDAVTGGKMPACSEYHIPEHLREHVDYITPGIKLFAPQISKRALMREDAKATRRASLQKRRGGQKGSNPLIQPAPFPQFVRTGNSTNSSSLDTCDVTITPACIAALYQIPPTDLSKPVSKDNSMGVFESEAQYYDQEDLDLFFANFTPQIPKGTTPIPLNIDGANAVTTNVSDAGEEAMLDLELVYPIVYPQTVTVFQEDDPVYEQNPNTTYTFGFNTFLDAIDGSYCTYCAYGECGDSSIDPQYPDPADGGYKGQLQCGVYKPTPVISVSYGGQEVDVPVSYQKRQCDEYLKLGLQGVSILFASGDSGVSTYPPPYGIDGPTGCIGKDLNVFNPTWPNNCPWLTNVGATKVYAGKTVYDPESAVYDPAGHPYHVNYSSGGGFSNVYPVPDYQKSAVDTFFSDHDPSYPYYSGFVNDSSQFADLGANGGIYNRIGRGIPDVAANGDNAAVYVAGVFARGGGTSQATPIFAAVVNRINEERFAAGKSPVGFINPTLYQNPQILNDITNGSNPGCDTIGFTASTGWDPVTGLGTPNYPKMLELFMGLL